MEKNGQFSRLHKEIKYVWGNLYQDIIGVTILGNKLGFIASKCPFFPFKTLISDVGRFSAKL